MCPKCPKCNSEIDGLRNIVSGSQEYDMCVTGSGEIHYEGNDFVDDSNVNEYWCPECDECLFTSEEEAVKFLKNEDELKSLIQDKLEKKNG